MEENQKSEFDSLNLNLNDISINYLKEAAKWAYFLGIVGFVSIGLLLLSAIFAGSLFSSSLGALSGAYGGLSGTVFTVYFIVIAAIYFFPVFYLYKFGKGTKDAIKNNDTATLTEGLKNLKSHYKFIGILLAITLGLYAIMLVFAVIAGLFAAVA